MTNENIGSGIHLKSLRNEKELNCHMVDEIL